MSLRNMLIIFCIALIGGCAKMENNLPVEEWFVGKDVRINDVTFLSPDSGFAVGGRRLESGFVFRTVDGGNTWQALDMGYPRSLGAVAEINGELWAGGEWIHLYRSQDGLDWNFDWLDSQQPASEENRPLVRQFVVENDTSFWFVGGENYNEGVIYHTWDSGDNWSFSTWEYQVNALAIHPDFKIAAAHGGLLVSNSNSESFALRHTENHYSGVRIFEDGHAVIVGNQGGIWISEDQGETLEKILPDAALRRAYTAMEVVGGKLVAVGFDGLVSVSEDEGYSWNHHRLEGKPHLIQVADFGEYGLATGDGGKVYRFKVPS